MRVPEHSRGQPDDDDNGDGDGSMTILTMPGVTFSTSTCGSVGRGTPGVTRADANCCVVGAMRTAAKSARHASPELVSVGPLRLPHRRAHYRQPTARNPSGWEPNASRAKQILCGIALAIAADNQKSCGERYFCFGGG